MSRKKKKHGGHDEGFHADERWIVSYADILTLLLALFIVMFAMSKVDAAKFKTFAEGAAEAMGQGNVAFQGKTGTLDGSDGILTGQKPTQEEEVPNKVPNPSALAQKALADQIAKARAARAEKENMAKLRDKIAAELAKRGLKDAVQFQLDERGLVVNIVTDKVLFDSGQADLRKDGIAVLDTIAPSVKTLPNRVTVEGHTDNVPITGRFQSNWELSTTRATTVVQELIRSGLPASRITAAGYADQRPLAVNTTDAGRARNRRVAIVVLPMASSSTADPEIDALAASDGVSSSQSGSSTQKSATTTDTQSGTTTESAGDSPAHALGTSVSTTLATTIATPDQLPWPLIEGA